MKVHYLAEVTPLTIPNWGTDCNGTSVSCVEYMRAECLHVFLFPGSWNRSHALGHSLSNQIAHSQCLFIPVSGMERGVDMEGEWERRKGDVRRTKRPKAPKRPIPQLEQVEMMCMFVLVKVESHAPQMQNSLLCS